MVNPKRDVLDIMVSILTSLSDTSQKKTRLGNMTNLDSRTLNKYVGVLTRLNLIAYSDSKRSYPSSSPFLVITGKGIQFLSEYDRIRSILQVTRKELLQVKASD